MPGPTGQHTHILQQERATKKMTGVDDNHRMGTMRVTGFADHYGIDITNAEGVEAYEHYCRHA